jgi:hypothetical protein
MASLRTPTPRESSHPGIRILEVGSCVTGDTVYCAGPVRSWKATNLTTTDAIACTYSRTTSLFTVTVANTPDIHIWVLA